MKDRPLERAHALLFDLDRPELAERELYRVLAATPDDPYAHALLAQALGRQGNFDGAERSMREAIRLSPGSTIGHRVRGWLRERQDRLPEAERAFREVLRIDPTDPYAHQALADVLLRQGRAAEALAVADQGLSCNARNVGCLNARAAALVKLERFDEAEEALDAAVRVDPADPMTHSNRGWVASLRRRHRPALHSYLAALERDPQDAWARRALHAQLVPMAEGFFVLLLVVAIAAAGVGMLGAGENNGLRRLCFGAAVVFGLPAGLGMAHFPLKLAVLRLTRWGRFAGLPGELEFGRRLAFGCAALSLANALVWAVAPDMVDALAGSIVAVAVAVPFLLQAPGLPARDWWRRLAVAGGLLVPAAALSVVGITAGRPQAAGVFALGLLAAVVLLRKDAEPAAG